LLYLSNAFNSKPEDEERPSRKSNGKEVKSAQSLLLDVKDVSSWKGPNLKESQRSRLANAIFFIERLVPHKLQDQKKILLKKCFKEQMLINPYELCLKPKKDSW
jgi:hypothetical protein